MVWYVKDLDHLSPEAIVEAVLNYIVPIAIILIIIGVLIIGGGAYYLSTQKSTQPIAASQPTPSPTPSVSPTPSATDKTANWKTYRNEKYGFEMKYPKNFKIIELMLLKVPDVLTVWC